MQNNQGIEHFERPNINTGRVPQGTNRLELSHRHFEEPGAHRLQREATARSSEWKRSQRTKIRRTRLAAREALLDGLDIPQSVEASDDTLLPLQAETQDDTKLPQTKRQTLKYQAALIAIFRDGARDPEHIVKKLNAARKKRDNILEDVERAGDNFHDPRALESLKRADLTIYGLEELLHRIHGAAYQQMKHTRRRRKKARSKCTTHPGMSRDAIRKRTKRQGKFPHTERRIWKKGFQAAMEAIQDILVETTPEPEATN